ncbi:MAG: hypothetical protein OXI92_11160 [Acidobacteriota bacterium]|nr:hypothetical protein [Acidobacteriota bacterium]
MEYKALRSIVASQKNPVALQSQSNSFYASTTRVSPFIEPRFSKISFPQEKPSILLVSAVGASGKTTAANALSFDLQLPILDLAKHKAVGDNTLTGILTTAYPIAKVGTVLEGLHTGTHGIIIDGIDEGRSKTTEQGFEAFLDDLIQRSMGSASTAIVVLGRSQVLFSTWVYLDDKGADVGMVEIDPFGLEQAKKYIDSRVIKKDTSQQESYESARDAVLHRLGAAFVPAVAEGKNAFLSFIGYPPVLDAIATLLREERNYHRIQYALNEDVEGQLETNLLIRICDHLLDRDHEEKALPNFIEAIATDVGGSFGEELRISLYNKEEQCARVLSRTLNRPFPKRVIDDNALNEKYESSVEIWCQDHPFLDDARLRNAVFAALSVTRCALSNIPEYQDLAHAYVSASQPTYHLLYLLNELAKGREINVRFFNMLIQSCSDFLGINAELSIEIDGNGWEEVDGEHDISAELMTAIRFPDKQQERTFVFNGNGSVEAITLGPYIVNTSVTLPCTVELSGTPAIVAVGECKISARRVRIDTPDLILRNMPRLAQEDIRANAGLFINSREAEGYAKAVSVGSGKLEIQCVEHTLDYPLARYVHKVAVPFDDPMLQEKYRRIRRIFSEFASHGKGALAKYRAKIEHERVLRNELGRSILDALLAENVLRRDSKFYYIVPDQCDAKLGISWHQLRKYKSSKKLEEFLKNVPFGVD